MDYTEIWNLDSEKTKAIYSTLWEIMGLDFTMHNTEFRMQISSILWMFFRNVGLKE